MPGREAVILNWRLFWRSLEQASGELWFAIAAAMAAAALMGRPAFDLGQALAANEIPPDQLALILGVSVWSTFLAAFVYSLATSELSFIRILLADFALRPVSRWQALLAMQVIWTAGPHALALPSVGLAWLIVLVTWLDGAALAAAIAASFVMMRLSGGLMFAGSRLLSASLPTAAITVLTLLAAVAVLWVAVPELVVWWSPPGLVAQIVMDGVVSRAWIGLAAWTLVVAAAEFWSAGLERAPRSSPLTAARPPQPIPLAVTLVARLGGCPAVLLHGELLRLVRWRRYQLTLLAGALVLAGVGARAGEQSGLMHVAFALLVLVNIGGSALVNLFATDRAGFHALLMSPAGMPAVIRAKVIAILLFTVALEVAAMTLMLVRGATWPLVAAGAILSAGLFMWAAATGMISSVLFPSPSDPQTVGGALVNTPAFIVVALGDSLYLGTALGLAYMFDGRHWPSLVCTAAGVTLVAAAAAAVALTAASSRSSKLIALRQEVMLSTLTSPGARA